MKLGWNWAGIGQKNSIKIPRVYYARGFNFYAKWENAGKTGKSPHHKARG
jgi:hypothetical protein